MYEGRYNRARYFWAMVGIAVLAGVAAMVVGVGLHSTGAEQAGLVAFFLIQLVGIVWQSGPIVKRLHDLNRPGTHFWLLLAPLYNIYFALVLLIEKGTDGDNPYGPDRLARRQ